MLVTSLLLLAGLSTAAEPARVYRKADGTVCMVYVDTAGKIAETCEESPVKRPADVPAPPPAHVDLTPGVHLSASQVDLLGTVSLKHGWSGALKLAAIRNAIAAMLEFIAAGQDPTTGSAFMVSGFVNLGLGVVDLVVGALLDSSATSDLAEAKGEHHD